MSIFNKIFKSYSEKEVKRIMPIVDKINSLEEEISKLTDEELKNKTNEFKEQLDNGKTLDDILPEAFAVVREASKRVLGMRHFDVQLIGGIILHQGRIAEMKTGEGKTLVATLPVYLNALTGRGVHVITVNDYLAKRDSEWMGKLYKFMGLSVGLVIAGMDPKAKQKAYACDITYGTNNEFGFDYLRDNMVIYKEQLVQRDLAYAIVDEIDSILIDEARTPLIISGRANQSSDLYKKANNIENEIDGIEATEEQINNNIKVTRVKIMNEQGERALGKVKGNYVTIDMKNMKYMGEEEIQKASEILCKELKKMIDEYVNKEQEILVVGLGNIYVTPDALGPKVINEIDITRHLLKYVPQYLDKNTRPVSAISPGVLGTTGMETAEILKGIVDNVKPKLVIVIDSLASRSMERISSTIQLADTGIVPGAGVDNARKELTINTLEVPVIALGIPTVVETAVVVNDCLDVFIEKLQEKAESNEYLNKLKEEDNYLEIKEALIPKNFNFIVTPKEIDSLVENMKDVVARGINMSL